jgi:hypothetical protein
VRQDWEPEDLIEVWTLLADDMKRVRKKSWTTRLGVALLRRFFEVEARFPGSAKEGPDPAVEYVAQGVKVPAAAWFLPPAAPHAVQKCGPGCGALLASRSGLPGRPAPTGVGRARSRRSGTAAASRARSWGSGRHPGG